MDLHIPTTVLICISHFSVFLERCKNCIISCCFLSVLIIDLFCPFCLLCWSQLRRSGSCWTRACFTWLLASLFRTANDCETKDHNIVIKRWATVRHKTNTDTNDYKWTEIVKHMTHSSKGNLKYLHRDTETNSIHAKDMSLILIKPSETLSLFLKWTGIIICLIGCSILVRFIRDILI